MNFHNKNKHKIKIKKWEKEKEGATNCVKKDDEKSRLPKQHTIRFPPAPYHFNFAITLNSIRIEEMKATLNFKYVCSII